MNSQKTLCFKYSDENRDENAKELISMLKDHKFNYVAYNNVDYWLFRVQKPSGWTWNKVMAFVNSVRAAKYWYVNTIIMNGVEYF